MVDTTHAARAENGTVERIQAAVTDAICRCLALQAPGRGAAYFRDMLLAQTCAAPAQRATALCKLAAGEEQHADQRLIRDALRLVEVQAQLLADASVTVQEIVAHESERLLEALGAPPEADPDCHLPSPLAETVADLTTRDVLDVLGAVEAVVAAQDTAEFPPNLELLALAADRHRAVQALPPVAGGTAGAGGADAQLLSDWLSGVKPGANAGDRVALRAEVQPALEALCCTVRDLQGCLQSAAQEASHCDGLHRDGGAAVQACRAVAEEHQRAALRYSAAVAEAAAQAAVEEERRAADMAAVEWAQTEGLQARYRRIEALRQELAAECRQAQQQEEALLAHVAQQQVRAEAAAQLPAVLAEWRRAGEEAARAADAQAQWAAACYTAFDDILSSCEKQLKQYGQQVTHQLHTTQESHWLTFTCCCQFVEHHLAEAQRKRLKGAQALQRREAEYAEWRRQEQPEAAGTEEWAVFQRGEARWEQEVGDMRVLQDAREREVACWLEARAAICKNMEESGTKEALADRPQGRSLVEQDPRETFGQTDRQVECQAAVRQLLQLMRQTHDRFGEFYEEVRMAEDWEGSWGRLAEACAALQQLAVALNGSGGESGPTSTTPTGSAVSLSTVLCPTDLDAYLTANPFLAKQLADGQRSLREDLLTFGREVEAAWQRPCPNGGFLTGEDLMATWASMLSAIDGLLEPVDPDRRRPGLPTATAGPAT
eukprot:EG_transcript_4243